MSKFTITYISVRLYTTSSDRVPPRTTTLNPHRSIYNCIGLSMPHRRKTML